MSTELLHIKLTEIHENPVALRSVNQESPDFLGLVDSIRARGVMNAISVRRKMDKDTNEQFYELIDGLHRFAASMAAGINMIPAQVLTLEDAEVLEAQLIGNVQRIDTKPVEYSQQLIRILGANPTMTESDLAIKLGKSAQWISARLGLTKIDNQTIRDLIDEGQIPLSNAYTLAKLPTDEQLDFVERAQTETPDVFLGGVANRVKELREAKRQGREAKPAEFAPTAHCQKISTIKEAMDNDAMASQLIDATGTVGMVGAFQLALQWVLNLDPISIEAARAKWTAQQQAKAEATERRAAERAAAKAESAQAAANKAAAEAEANAS